MERWIKIGQALTKDRMDLHINQTNPSLILYLKKLPQRSFVRYFALSSQA